MPWTMVIKRTVCVDLEENRLALTTGGGAAAIM